MAATKAVCRTAIGLSCRSISLRLECFAQLFHHLGDHDLRADRALMRQVEAEIDRGLAHFSFQITRL